MPKNVIISAGAVLHPAARATLRKQHRDVSKWLFVLRQEHDPLAETEYELDTLARDINARGFTSSKGEGGYRGDIRAVRKTVYALMFNNDLDTNETIFIGALFAEQEACEQIGVQFQYVHNFLGVSLKEFCDGIQ